MKKFVVSALAAMSCIYSFAQSPVRSGNDDMQGIRTVPRRHHPRAPLYIDLSSGINNNAGIFGVGLEVPVSLHISVEGGGGMSSWGEKAYLCGKYYLQGDLKGWAFGPGVTYSTGPGTYTTDMETIHNTSEQVSFYFNAQTSVFIAAYRSWSLGRNRNRVYIEFGLSKGLNPVGITQTAGSPIKDKSVNTVGLMPPGGPILAAGLSFGGGRRKE